MPKSMPTQEVISGPASATAGAGRGMVNPRPVNVSEEDYVSPAARYEMDKQRQEDREMRQATESYNKASGMKKGGNVSSASKRADGIAAKGKTKGRYL
jgi:hypothetical protein